jgi:hypothetical protein
MKQVNAAILSKEFAVWTGWDGEADHKLSVSKPGLEEVEACISGQNTMFRHSIPIGQIVGKPAASNMMNKPGRLSRCFDVCFADEVVVEVKGERHESTNEKNFLLAALIYGFGGIGSCYGPWQIRALARTFGSGL